MTTIIRIPVSATQFAEDKDEAKALRQTAVLPALARGETLVLNFDGVRYATQSFVHALLGEALKRHGERVLERVEFKNCSPQLRAVIELVVAYSLTGFPKLEPSRHPVLERPRSRAKK